MEVLVMKKLTRIFIASVLIVMLTMTVEAVKLYPGEKLVGDTIVGETIISPADGEIRLYWDKDSDCPNFCSSKETLQYWYTGYIQFQPAYRTQYGDPCDLKPNRNVCQAWIDYVRKDSSGEWVSVCDGPHYTRKAYSIYDTDFYFKKTTAHDSLIIGEAGKTHFSRGWLYFAE